MLATPLHLSLRHQLHGYMVVVAMQLVAEGNTLGAPVRPSYTSLRCHASLHSSFWPQQRFQVYLEKPLGVKFARGNDGGAYVARR